jgi:hypothetical protein
MQTKRSTPTDNAPHPFIQKYQADVIGILHGFDRLRFQGTLRCLYHRNSMEAYLQQAKVLYKDFKSFATGITSRIHESARQIAQAAGRPFRYLPSSQVRKEEEAKEIARQDKIEAGLIAVLSCVEPCRTYFMRGNRQSKHLELKLERGKCLHFYFYQYHPLFGFMYLRLQSWFPFQIHIGINGREWLQRQMDAAGLSYERRENCFTSISNLESAQALMKSQLQSDWPKLCNQLVSDFHPLHEEISRPFPLPYYWSVSESEYASDVMFREAATLRRLYPRIVHHAITSFGSTEVLRFLGRRASDDGGRRTGHPFEGEVTSDMRQRHEGIRVKHRRDTNSIKIYDKQGSVLRTETIINNPRDFQVYRASENAPEGEKTWRILRRGVADLYRRAEICQAANQRYLSALAAVSAGAPLGEEAARVCAPVRQHGRRHRALNPLWLEDATLLQAVNRGEFALDGLRNRDLRALLWDGSTCDKKTNRRRAAAVTRKLRLLRAHGLLRKVSHTHRYVVTDQGRRIITALLSALKADVEQLAEMAA